MVSELDRRRSLTTIGSFVIGLLTLPSVTGAERDSTPGVCRRAERRNESANTEGVTNRSDRYVAVVDRIVDGAHVVLLLEEDDEVVDQLVVPREDLPDVEESDVLLVAVEDGELIDSKPLRGETRRRRRRAEDRLECLLEAADE